MKALASNQRFHDYLKVPRIKAALDHWVGINRIKDRGKLDEINRDPDIRYVCILVLHFVRTFVIYE